MDNAYIKITKGQPRTRRIPGPADTWDGQDEKTKETTLTQQWTKNKANDGMSRIKISLINTLFLRGSWLNAMIDYKMQIIAENNVLYMKCSEDNQFHDNLSQIKKCQNTIFKIEKIIVLLKDITILKEAIGIMIDPFDEIKCLFHRECFTTKHKIQPGSVLVLKNVSIMHSGPTKNDYYVCVTNSNIDKIYCKNTKIPISLVSVLHDIYGNKSHKCNQISKNQSKLPKVERQFLVTQYMNIFNNRNDSNTINVNINLNVNDQKINVHVNEEDVVSEPLNKKRRIVKGM